MAFETSALYKEAIDKPSRVTFIDGELTTTSGTVIQITNDVIDQGSCYITNQCVSSDAFAYGSVFAAEAGITLKTEVDRYSLYDSVIKLNFNILLGDGTYERIPLGKYYVNDPKRIGKSIALKAYDEMVNLDIKIDESTTGKPFELLVMMSEKFGFELSQTQAEIETLVNGDKLLSVDQTLIETYRDLLSYVGLVTCTFAYFDRYGKLKLSTFKNEHSRVIQAKQRTSSSFSDFETYYSSISASFLVGGSYETYLHTEETGGLLYDMGDVPVVQGTPEINQETLDLIYEQLSLIKYTPCDISFNGDPSVDLGDKIVNIDRFGNEITSLVTYFKWSYRNGHQIKSAGSNPKLSNMKEKVSKEITKLQTEIAKKSIPVYTYTNSSSYELQSEETIVILNFSASDDTSAVFMTTVNFEMDLDGVAEFSVYLDGVLFDNSTVRQYCSKGKNVVTFVNYIPCEKNHRYGLTVRAKTYYEESDIRVNAAKIATNENARNAVVISYESIVSALKNASTIPITSLSETVSYDVVLPSTIEPTMNIEKYNVKSIVFAQGLASKTEWGGTITVTEEVTSMFEVVTDEFALWPASDTLSIEPQIPTSSIVQITTGFFNVETDEVELLGVVTEEVLVNEVVTSYSFNVDKASQYEYNSDYVVDDEAFKLQTVFEYKSTEQTIDRGRMCSVKIMTSDKQSIESVVIE